MYSLMFAFIVAQEFLPWVEDSRVLSVGPSRPLTSSAHVTDAARGGSCVAAVDTRSKLCELCVGFGPFNERSLIPAICLYPQNQLLSRYVSAVTVEQLPGGCTVVKAEANDRSRCSLLCC
jgi:hypothetical protein